MAFEASVDNIHARKELLLFCSSSVPHNRFLTFSDTWIAFCPGLAYCSQHICPVSLSLGRGVQRKEHSVNSTGVERFVSLPVSKTWESSRLSENQVGLTSYVAQDLPIFFQLNLWGETLSWNGVTLEYSDWDLIKKYFKKTYGNSRVFYLLILKTFFPKNIFLERASDKFKYLLFSI